MDFQALPHLAASGKVGLTKNRKLSKLASCRHPGWLEVSGPIPLYAPLPGRTKARPYGRTFQALVLSHPAVGILHPYPTADEMTSFQHKQKQLVCNS